MASKGAAISCQPSFSEPPADPELLPDPADMSYDRINHQTGMDEVQGTDASTVENLDRCRSLQEENIEGASPNENDLYRFQKQNPTFDNQQVTANFQQLNVKDHHGFPSEGDDPLVVIPSPNCRLLTPQFGSFGSGIGGLFCGPLASAPVKSSLDDVLKHVDGSSVGQLESRYTSF